MKKIFRFAAVVVAIALLAVPVFAARGSADFTRFVTIGDSYGAGFQSNSLNERHQQFSWPAIVARQAGLKLCSPAASATENCFAQPLVSYPGIQNEMTLVDLKPTIGVASGTGQPIVTTFGRPYNNLSIPGANVSDVTTITGAEANPTRGVELLARFILRGLGTEVQQACAQNPTFIGIWIGGNDFLGAVTAGTPKLLTPKATFQTAYEKMLDNLIACAPNAGMVVGTLPTNPLAVPFLTTVPPVLVDPTTRQPVLGPDGKPIFFIYKTDTGVAQLTSTSVVLLSALPKIQRGQGLPPAFKNIPPFSLLPDTGTPLTDNDVITGDELPTMLGRVAEYNEVINAAATARNIPVADIKGLFEKFASPNGVFVGPFQLKASYISGGLFSLDGVHISDMGYMLFANEYIKAINAGYHTEIPLASLTMFLDNNGAFFPDSGPSSLPIYDTTGLTLTDEAASQLMSVIRAQQPAKKFRATNH